MYTTVKLRFTYYIFIQASLLGTLLVFALHELVLQYVCKKDFLENTIFESNFSHIKLRIKF